MLACLIPSGPLRGWSPRRVNPPQSPFVKGGRAERSKSRRGSHCSRGRSTSRSRGARALLEVLTLALCMQENFPRVLSQITVRLDTTKRTVAVPVLRRCRGRSHLFADEAAFGRGGSDKEMASPAYAGGRSRSSLPTPCCAGGWPHAAPLHLADLPSPTPQWDPVCGADRAALAAERGGHPQWGPVYRR